MTALWICLGAAALIGGILCLRAHVVVCYEAGELQALLKLGPFHYRLLPGKPKDPEAVKAKQAQKRHDAGLGDSGYDKLVMQIRTYRALVGEILPLIPLARRTIVITRLRLRVLLADDDPADLALHYGQSMALLGSIVPVVANVVPLKEADVDTECMAGERKFDFTANLIITTNIAKVLRLGLQYLKNRRKTAREGTTSPTND